MQMTMWIAVVAFSCSVAEVLHCFYDQSVNEKSYKQAIVGTSHARSPYVGYGLLLQHKVQ